MVMGACRSSKDSAGGGSGDKPPMGTVIPFLQRYYIGNKPYNKTLFEPQLSDKNMAEATYILNGDIGVIGTIADGNQNIEAGVIYISQEIVHYTILFKKGTKLYYVSHDANSVTLTGNIQGEVIKLKFVSGNGGLRFYKPDNGKVILFGQSFDLTPNSTQASIDIVVVKNKDVKSVTTKGEGIEIKPGSPNNGENNGGTNGGNNGGYNNGGNNGNYNNYNNNPNNYNNNGGGQPELQYYQKQGEPAPQQQQQPKKTTVPGFD
jgi:hypothetical protein